MEKHGKVRCVLHLMCRRMTGVEGSHVTTFVVKKQRFVNKDVPLEEARYCHNYVIATTNSMKHGSGAHKLQKYQFRDLVLFVRLDIASTHPAKHPLLYLESCTDPGGLTLLYYRSHARYIVFLTLN